MKRFVISFFTVLFLGLIAGVALYGAKKGKDPLKLKKAQTPVQLKDGVLFSFQKDDAETVAIAGDFNNWDASKNLLKKNKYNVWYIVLPLKKGEYAYKFVVNGSEWVPDPNNKNTKDDGYGGVNSVIKVTKNYDLGGVKVKNGMVIFKYYNPSAKKVAVAGSFNDWSKDANVMKKGKNGYWILKIKLDPGTYQYKYVVDDNNWVPDPANDNTSDDGYGGINSVVEVK